MHKYIINHEKIFNIHRRHYNRIFILDLHKNDKKRKKIIPNSVINEFGMIASSPVEVVVGGATIFVLNVEDFKKL
jgi:uncharacterized protein YaaQ